jgi:hypothetical protein
MAVSLYGANGLQRCRLFKEKTMSHPTQAPRRMRFALLFALLLTLAGLGLLKQTAQANLQLAEKVFLPLIIEEAPLGSSIPPR